IVIPELPYIPLYTQITWSRYHTTYWTGWPTVDNPGPGTTCSWAEQHLPQIIMGLESTEAPPEFVCDICGATFDTSEALIEHIAAEHPSAEFVCDICGAIFDTQELLDAHMEAEHPAEEIPWTYIGIGIVVLVVIALLAVKRV
ncbi:unnamed protein product, partial [marine sediment metagenome]